MGRNITNIFCTKIYDLAQGSLSSRLIIEGKRALLNGLGTAIGASQKPPIHILVDLAMIHGGEGRVPIPGRREIVDIIHGALAIGLAIHLDDFDDTHPYTLIHPTAPVLGAVLSLGSSRQVSGEKALKAFVIGCEAELRIGSSLFPSHYDAGWHITGTCGVFGAAIASSIILGLDKLKIIDALCLAANQTLGLQEAFGTMTKAFHPGKAAANGLLSALLAQRGYTGKRNCLEAPGGIFKVLGKQDNFAIVEDGLGEDWFFLNNTYKAYPCGLVMHPAMDAALSLNNQVQDIFGIRRINVHCNPRVVTLTGIASPKNGLEARFSTQYAVAVALVDGRVTDRQFEDDRLKDNFLMNLCSSVHLMPDPKVGLESATVEIVLNDGSRHVANTTRIRGGIHQPLTEKELFEKVRNLIEPVIPGRTAEIIKVVETLDAEPNLNSLISAMTPSQNGSYEKRVSN
jgi:2-methylcitrate dehydratase PrpD